MARAVSAPDIAIRFATAEDVPLVLRFIRQLAVFERAPDAVVATEADLLHEVCEVMGRLQQLERRIQQRAEPGDS